MEEMTRERVRDLLLSMFPESTKTIDRYIKRFEAEQGESAWNEWLGKFAFDKLGNPRDDWQWLVLEDYQLYCEE